MAAPVSRDSMLHMQVPPMIGNRAAIKPVQPDQVQHPESTLRTSSILHCPGDLHHLWRAFRSSWRGRSNGRQWHCTKFP